MQFMGPMDAEMLQCGFDQKCDQCHREHELRNKSIHNACSLFGRKKYAGGMRFIFCWESGTKNAIYLFFILAPKKLADFAMLSFAFYLLVNINFVFKKQMMRTFLIRSQFQLSE